MDGSSKGNPSAWDEMPSRNLLLPENLDLVRKELANDSVVFGWHYYYSGGRSGDMFCFSDYESYYQELSNSQPGDHLTVYSRNRVVTRAMVHVGDPTSTQPFSNAHEFVEVKNALSAGKEIVFLWCHAPPETGRIECGAGALWDPTEEEFQESLGLGSGRCGEFMFFQVEMLDEDEAGVPIDSVSPGSRRRVHAVVDGKRPDEAGFTPASGPY